MKRSSLTKVTLGDLLVAIEAGRSFSGASGPAGPDEWGIIKVSAMTYGTFRETENKSIPAGSEFSLAHEIKAGDLLVSRANTQSYVGASVLVHHCRPRLLLSDKSLRLITVPGVDRRWLWHALSSPESRAYLSNASTGVKSGMRNISQSTLKNLPLELPSLVEQQRIVDILEGHLSRLDSARGTLELTLRRLRSLHRAKLHAVINQPHRKLVPLAHLVERIEAGRSFGGAAPPAGANEWGVVRVSAMTWGAFRASENKRVPSNAVDPRFEIHAGDLLVSRANTSTYVGASVLVKDVRPRLLLSDKSLRLISIDGVRSDWLQLALSAPAARSQISEKSTGTKDSMRNISQASLLSVLVPNVDECTQETDVQSFVVQADAAARLQTAIERGRVAGMGLQRSLLSAAFSGKLTERPRGFELNTESTLV